MTAAASTSRERAAATPSPRVHFYARGRFARKAALLTVTTLVFVPILLSQHALAARLYVGLLVAVHVAGAAVFAWGVRRQDIAPTRRGLAVRALGLVALVALLALSSKGLHDPTRGALFWGSLTAIWALHTAGLLLLHVRTPTEQLACPFH